MPIPEDVKKLLRNVGVRGSDMRGFYLSFHDSLSCTAREYHRQNGDHAFLVAVQAMLAESPANGDGLAEEDA